MDCLTRVLEFYDRKEKEGISQPELNRLWLSNLLIKIMSKFNGNINSSELKSCLILLVNLFDCNDGADHYSGKGKALEELSEGEKSIFKRIMAAELTNN
ncbi:MAG: hypothetical protein EU517_01195 [Promethearchaeota archaeon]|nr:MAG: hypothetical protein EU517_01195 [Candidatus Lokiarchaeota archaeon]